MGATLTVYATRLGTSTHQPMGVASPRASTVISATVSSGGAQSPAGDQPDGASGRSLGRRGFGYLQSGRPQSLGVDSGWIGHDRSRFGHSSRCAPGRNPENVSESVAETIQDATVSRSAVSCFIAQRKDQSLKLPWFRVVRPRADSASSSRSKTSPSKVAISRLCWARYGLELSPQPLIKCRRHR